MATFRQRGPYQWQARVQKQGYEGQTRTFTTKEEAEVWAAEIELSMKKSEFQCQKEARATSLAKALERYRDEISPRKKGHIPERNKINQLLRHPITELSLAELSGQELILWRDAQLKLYSANTVRLKLAVISNLYTIARKEWGYKNLYNPVADIKLPVVNNERDRRLNPGEEERLLESASPTMKNIITLAIETAMRRSELLLLEWDRVHGNRVQLRWQDTKNKKPRVVPLSTKAMASLPERGNGRVFDLHPDSVSHEFLSLCRSLGIEDLHFHDLRHEGVSRLFEKGLSMVEVMSISGHRTTSQLLRYTHLIVDDLAAKLG